MSVGLGIDLPIKISTYYASRTPKGHYVHPPGKPVGVIQIKPRDLREGEYNNLFLIFSVNPFREYDYKRVLAQSKRKGKLSPYYQSLFNSCFKNW